MSILLFNVYCENCGIKYQVDIFTFYKKGCPICKDRCFTLARYEDKIKYNL